MNSSLEIPVGARESVLSQKQVDEVLKELQAHYPHVTFDPTWVKTRGDRDQKSSLASLDKTDFFTREIDQLLLQREVRLGVHSAKDLPDPLPQGLSLIALTEGVDPSDSLVFRKGESLKTLKQGALVGTSSKRREENILSLRSDLQCVDIRGTIIKRLQQLEEGKVDTLIVAQAALIRLGLTHLPYFTLPGPVAEYQGKLAIIARQEDKEMQEFFSVIDSRAT